MENEGYESSTTYMYDSQTGWRRATPPPTSGPGQTYRRRETQTTSASFTIFWPLLMGMTLGFLFISLMRRTEGAIENNNTVWGRLRRWISQASGPPGRRNNSTHVRGDRRMSRSERVASIAAAIQTLPIEIFHTKEELERMSVSELKSLLKKTKQNVQAKIPTVLEKQELVSMLLSGSNTTAESCSICIEDYEAGDVLRVLRCGHRFHLECIDRWFLSSTDYSRPSACPICNTELILPAS